jgi:WS/DGAT/MGAT family acyltransferase
VPGPLGLLRRSTVTAVTHPGAALDWTVRIARSGVGAGLDLLEGEQHASPMLFRAPRSPFNVPISSRREFDAVDLPLDEIRALRTAAPGATVNDVVLAVCGGGLGRYLRSRCGLPARDLVAMAPISVRDAVADGGNRVSAMLLPLETRAKDPLARLARIHRHAVESKAYARAIGARTLVDSSSVVPCSLATAAARLYSGLRLSRYHRPPFNLVITNVPGPREPLYLGTAELVRGYGTAPVLDGLGLILVVTSYRDLLTISATAGHEAVPDPGSLVASLQSAFEELKEAAGKAAARGKPRARRASGAARGTRRRRA